jgi:hypothetical protein
MAISLTSDWPGDARSALPSQSAAAEVELAAISLAPPITTPLASTHVQRHTHHVGLEFGFKGTRV